MPGTPSLRSHCLAARHGLVVGLLLPVLLAACEPTVRIEAPQEPITINLNVRIEQRIRLEIEEEARELLEERDELF